MTGQQPDPGAGVLIPAEQTYAEVRRIADGQTRLEAKLDAIHDDLRQSRSIQADHESRLRHLETDRVTPAMVEDHEVRLRHLEERRLPHSVINIVAAVGATIALVWQAVGH
jgi:hypothetical protein